MFFMLIVSSADHECCMEGVSTPRNCISRVDPIRSYNQDNMASFFKTVEVMASFSNTLGVITANELINNDATMPVAAFLKAVVRDLKKYMEIQSEANGQRILPIGYGAASCDTRDQELLEYLTAGGEDISIDFWTVGVLSSI